MASARRRSASLQRERTALVRNVELFLIEAGSYWYPLAADKRMSDLEKSFFDVFGSRLDDAAQKRRMQIQFSLSTATLSDGDAIDFGTDLFDNIELLEDNLRVDTDPDSTNIEAHTANTCDNYGTQPHSWWFSSFCYRAKRITPSDMCMGPDSAHEKMLTNFSPREKILGKMRSLYRTNCDIAEFQNRLRVSHRTHLFSKYYRNPKKNVRGFPSLHGGGDYGDRLSHGRQPTRKRIPYTVEIRLEFAPAGGVWAVADICEEDADSALGSACDSLQTAREYSGMHAEVVKADFSGVDRKKKIFTAQIMPRAWTCTVNLYGAKDKCFVLRVRVWVFSPLGFGLCIGDRKSNSFTLSSTTHLHRRKFEGKKREAHGHHRSPSSGPTPKKPKKITSK